MNKRNRAKILSCITAIFIVSILSCNSTKNISGNNYKYILFIDKKNKQWIDFEYNVFMLENINELSDINKISDQQFLTGEVAIPNYYDDNGKIISVKDTALILKYVNMSFVMNDKNKYIIKITDKNTVYTYVVLRAIINYIDCTKDCELFFSKEKEKRYLYPIEITTLKIPIEERKKIRNYIKQIHKYPDK
jgi:hypothetical protein